MTINYKRSFGAFLCLVILSCQSFAQDFIVLHANSQRWIAGIRGGGTGTNYEILVVAKKSSAVLQFGKLLIGDKILNVSFSHKPLNDEPLVISDKTEFAAGDTLVLKASVMHPGERIPSDNRNQNEETDEPKSKVKMKGEALICYKAGKKKKSFSIEKFEELPRLNYP